MQRKFPEKLEELCGLLRESCACSVVVGWFEISVEGQITLSLSSLNSWEGCVHGNTAIVWRLHHLAFWWGKSPSHCSVLLCFAMSFPRNRFLPRLKDHSGCLLQPQIPEQAKFNWNSCPTPTIDCLYTP